MSRYAESHKLSNLKGPGDDRPTALQIISDEGLTGKLTDKVFLITGVSSGIGIDTLRALHTTGAHVYGTVRDMPKGQKVVDQILSEKHEGGGKIDLILMDQSSLAGVRAGASDFLAKSGGKLNVLVANAAIMAPPYGKTVDGFEQQFAVNHLAHFLLFQLVKDAMLKSATPEFPSRYVSVSSGAHNESAVDFEDVNFDKAREYSGWKGYGQSKTANLWMANAIERHYSSQNLHGLALHPGVITENSGINKFIPEEEMEEMLGDEEMNKMLKSAAQGAATSVIAAVGKEWTGKGRVWMSNCMEVGTFEEEMKKEGVNADNNEGSAKWAFDKDGEDKLWSESLRWVGVHN